ncbi:hypothetical protein CL643_00180 [bacterium]|nr:hypothetical protein [bacterium]
MKKVKCLLLHGSGMSDKTWSALMSHFPKNWVVFNPTLPGHGSRDLQVKNLKELSFWLKQQIKKKKPDIVAGWSMGSFLLQNTINKYGKMNIKVASFINGSPAEKKSKTSKETLQQKLDNYFSDPIRHIKPTLNEMKEHWSQDDIKSIIKSCKNSDKTLLENLRWDMFETDFGKMIKNFPIPILLMHGIYDKINPLSQAKWVNKTAKKSLLFEFESRHAPFTKNPQLFVEKMIEGYEKLSC